MSQLRMFSWLASLVSLHLTSWICSILGVTGRRHGKTLASSCLTSSFRSASDSSLDWIISPILEAFSWVWSLGSVFFTRQMHYANVLVKMIHLTPQWFAGMAKTRTRASLALQKTLLVSSRAVSLSGGLGGWSELAVWCSCW